MINITEKLRIFYTRDFYKQIYSNTNNLKGEGEEGWLVKGTSFVVGNGQGGGRECVTWI